MIIGIGNDLIDITRIENTLNRFGERFIQRVFTDTEQKKAESREKAGLNINTYAKRFAAKEALSKALGTGFSQGVFMKDIGVINDTSGRPTIKLTGGAEKKLQTLTPSGKQAIIHLTLTDEPPLAEAQVIIEAR
jgi:holo-[acyl-carrier protein] synthase